MSVLKRKSISIREKISIIDAVDRGDKSKQEIAKQFNIPPSTLSTILKNREIICNTKPLKCKRLRLAEYEDVEQWLSKWFTQCRNQNIPLGGPMVKTKAEQFAALLPSLLQNMSRKIFLMQTKLYYFLNAHQFERWRLKPKNATVESIVKKDYLFYLLLTVQALRRKLLIIGKSTNPRCFKNIKSLPVDYTANKKAWMTNDIWLNYLQKFDNDMTKANRKVSLFVDNCTAHKNAPLKSIKLQFLPANATSKLQPLDLGIIKNFKHFYRKEVVNILIDDLEEGRKSSINVLQ